MDLSACAAISRNGSWKMLGSVRRRLNIFSGTSLPTISIQDSYDFVRSQRLTAVLDWCYAKR
jgi:hypothetical protein